VSFHHLPPTRGTCVFCGETERIISWPTSDGGLGVCDLCTYALRHAWQKLRGELPRATTPSLVRTYALVPRLRAGRSEEDVSGYEFAVLENGDLPYAEWLKTDDALCSWLGRLNIQAWPETLRPCYLGYAGSADFSEVKLVWAWGKSLGSLVVSQLSSYKFTSFAELLALPTPDAGFYLGVKAAFESLLWRREVAPEGNELCVFLREPAMRYLRSLDGVSGEDDEAMVDVCHRAMSAEELEVAEILEEAKGKRAELAVREAEEAKKVVVRADESKTSGDNDDDDLAEGFARKPGQVIPPGGK
jgi:hypothetical protein